LTRIGEWVQYNTSFPRLNDQVNLPHMKESPISGVESLEVIQSMILKAKNQFSENGKLYLLWGWVILFCSLGYFILAEVVHYSRPYAIWALTWIAAVYMFFHLRREGKRRIVKTYTQDILGYIWIAFIIILFLGGFLMSRIPAFYLYNYQFVLLYYGVPTFLSGTVLKFKPLIYGGFICWILAFLSAFISVKYHHLLISLAVISAWIIPGYILKMKFKQANS